MVRAIFRINHPRDFKIFKNALGQFIPNFFPKHVITSTNWRLGGIQPLFNMRSVVGYIPFRFDDICSSTDYARCFFSYILCSFLVFPCDYVGRHVLNFYEIWHSFGVSYQIKNDPNALAPWHVVFSINVNMRSKI